MVLACYTLHVTNGNNIICKTIKSSTVSLYLSAAAKWYTDQGFPNPCMDIRGRRASHIQDILNECKRWENVKNKREPLTWDMIDHLHNSIPFDDGLISTLYDWFIIGMYSGFRLSEWAQSSSFINQHNDIHRSIDGLPHAIIRSDIQMGIKNNNDLFSIRWRYQKNGENGQKVTFAKSSNPNRCPLLAITRIIERSIRLNISDDMPLAYFLGDNNTPTIITDEHIQSVMQAIAKETYKLTSINDIKLWTSHSIRIGAAVALHEAGADFMTIKQRLRWKSDTFIMYLRNTPKIAINHSQIFENK